MNQQHTEPHRYLDLNLCGLAFFLHDSECRNWNSTFHVTTTVKLRNEQYLGNPPRRKAREKTNPKPKDVAQSLNIPKTTDQHFINAAVIRESEIFVYQSVCLAFSLVENLV